MAADESGQKSDHRRNHGETDTGIEHAQIYVGKNIERPYDNAESNHAGHDDVALDVEESERAYFILFKRVDPPHVFFKEAEKHEFEKQEENHRRDKDTQPRHGPVFGHGWNTDGQYGA